jgi:hypothetical protein
MLVVVSVVVASMWSTNPTVADADTCDRLEIPRLSMERCVVPGDQPQIDSGSVVRVDDLSSQTVHWLAGHQTSHGGTFRDLTGLRMGDTVRYRDRSYTVVDYELIERGAPGRVVEWSLSSTPSVLLQTSYSSSEVHIWRAIAANADDRPDPGDAERRQVTSLGQPVGVTLIEPARLLDTRRAALPMSAGEWRPVDLTADAGVPADAVAVFANVTVVGRGGPGYLVATRCDLWQRPVSNVNWNDSSPVANGVVIPIASGRFCIFTSAPADVVIDLEGYASPGSELGFRPVGPLRLLDTRELDGQPVRAGRSVRIELPEGLSEDPISGLSLTVTSTDSDAGFVAVHRCDRPFGLTSVLNTRGRAAVANGVVVPLDLTSGLCVTPSSTMHIVIDVNGFFTPTGARLQLVTPTRLVDTRRTDSDVVSRGFRGTTPSDRTIVDFGAWSAVGAIGEQAAYLNVTTVEAARGGFVTVWPCRRPRPVASVQNPLPGQATASSISVQTSEGPVCAFVLSTVHVVVDVLAVWVAVT